MESTPPPISSPVGSTPPSVLALDLDPERKVWWAKAVILGLAFTALVGLAGYVVGVRLTQPPTSAVDEGFLADMTSHHDQAVELAMLQLANGSDVTTRGFAEEVLLLQRWELGLMYAYQAERGAVQPEYSIDRPTMAWMDHELPLQQMPGMASEEQIARLSQATGRDADVLFLQLMQEHHRGGVHMASYAAEHARDPKVRELAARMARNQATEINEYQTEIDRLS
jgi:uncharacterized protein (DUF305 family)